MLDKLKDKLNAWRRKKAMATKAETKPPTERRKPKMEPPETTTIEEAEEPQDDYGTLRDAPSRAWGARGPESEAAWRERYKREKPQPKEKESVGERDKKGRDLWSMSTGIGSVDPPGEWTLRDRSHVALGTDRELIQWDTPEFRKAHPDVVAKIEAMLKERGL